MFGARIRQNVTRKCFKNSSGRSYVSFLSSSSHLQKNSQILATLARKEEEKHASTWIAAIAGSLLTYMAYKKYAEPPVEACGIVGYVGNDPAINYLMEGIEILQNRGYDSAGVCTISGKNELVTTKFASKGSTSDSVDLLKAKSPSTHAGDMIGIAHTRWATHGGKTDNNAHPHSDYKNRIALVHNGTIENSSELKQELVKKGIPFKSETDTEVIAQLIGNYLDQGLPLKEAVQKTLGRLEGTWGLAIISKNHPDQIIAARNGSPMVVGVDKNRMFVASETSAFSRYTNQFIALRDGEVAVITKDKNNLDVSRIELAFDEKIELDPSPYPHWTIKEIYEQPEAIARTLNYGGRFTEDGHVKLGGLDGQKEDLLSIKHLVIGACGTSLYASLYGAQIMRALRAFDTVQCVDASEVTLTSFPPHDGGLLVLSQSGETKDTHRALTVAQNLSLPTLSIVNKVGSLIARTASCGVYLNAGREIAVASTKAFTTQVTALALVSSWFSQNRSSEGHSKRAQILEAVQRLPIHAGMALKTHARVKELAAKLLASNPQHLFVLGKGYGEAIAREAALKIKEITYIHAEGYPAGALKHGPFALLDDSTPVILLIFDDEHKELMKTACAEVKARKAYTIIVTDIRTPFPPGLADEVIRIPTNGVMTALLSVIPLQLLAYELSVAKGINPDKPRNLAKAVTVA